MTFENYLKERGLASTTIESKIQMVRHLEIRFNLYDSEAIREYIKRYECTGRRKNNLSYAYRDWCRWKGSDYQFEKHKEKQSKLPYVPLESELDLLIDNFGPKYSAFLQLLKETGFRSIEARTIRPIDIDAERKIITLNSPAKNGLPRQFKLSLKLLAKLTPLIRKTSPKSQIWAAKGNTVRAIYCRKRDEIRIITIFSSI